MYPDSAQSMQTNYQDPTAPQNQLEAQQLQNQQMLQILQQQQASYGQSPTDLTQVQSGTPQGYGSYGMGMDPNAYAAMMYGPTSYS